MSVEIDPAELGFRRPFTREVSQILSLQNPNPDPVAFKVKTTAPKQYCVRPNSGRIESGETVEVQVLLQSMKEDPPLDVRCRDKFLVQSVALNAAKEHNNPAAIWSHMEQTSKDSIHEKKIRVTFLPADGSEDVNGASHHTDDGPPAYSSPSPRAYTPQHHSTTAPVGAISVPESKPEGNRHLGDAKASAYNPATSGIGSNPTTSGIGSSISAAAAGVADAIPTSMYELNAQLEEAKATIARLRQQAEEGLRHRRSEGGNQASKEKSSTTSTTAIGARVGQTGVPVQIVAALCLLCFLLAYFFF